MVASRSACRLDEKERQREQIIARNGSDFFARKIGGAFMSLKISFTRGTVTLEETVMNPRK
jgi:hypothetical protein